MTMPKRFTQKSRLNFTLSSVGIQARGRTSILKLNYRNTREILHFAFEFAQNYWQPTIADEDSVPWLNPLPQVIQACRQYLNYCR